MARTTMANEETTGEVQGEDWLTSAVAAHSRLVYGIAYRVLRNSTDAEDCVQEVFLRVWRFHRKLQRIEDEPAWFARIAWRTAIDRRRKRPEVSLDEAGAIVSLRSREQTPEELACDRQVVAWMEQLILALPQRLRDPLIMAAWGEMDAPEIAATLEISAASARSRLLRARRMLKTRILKQVKRKARHEQAG